MNIDFMRAIDYWVGVPACWFLSRYNGLRSLVLRVSPATGAPRKVLFIELSEMGSVVLAYPSIKYVKDRYPGAALYFMIFEKNRFCIEMFNIIPKENIVTIRTDNLLTLAVDTLKAVWRMRREGIDVGIDFELFARYTNILNFLCGCRRRVGFCKFNNEGLYRGSLLTHNVAYNAYYHMSRLFMALVEAIERPTGELPMMKAKITEEPLTVPRISDPEGEQRLLGRLRAMNGNLREGVKIIVFNPNASELLPIRKWPIDYYVELGRKILAHENTFIVLTGTESDHEACAHVGAALGNERCLDLCAKTSFKELINLYSVSDILITADSGPPHFAAVTGIKSIVFFGPETPSLYGPLTRNSTCLFSGFECSPCVSAYNHRKSPCTDNKCIQVITPERVHELVKNAIF